MGHLALTLRLTLAFVCMIAAAGKLGGFRDFVSSVEQMARSVPAIRAPASFARRWAAPALMVELAVAALLPWPGTALAGGVLAAGLFAALTASVATAAARGTAAPCACFGRVTRRLGRVHVARNAALTGLALLACWATALAGGGARVTATGAVACAVAALAVAQLVVHWDAAAEAGSGPPAARTMPGAARTAPGAPAVRAWQVLPAPGTPVPAGLAARTTDGSPLVTADFAGQDVVVAFLTSPCRSCQAALPRLREALGALPAGGPRPVVVLAGSAGDWPEYRAALSPLARVVESGDDVPKGQGVADLFGVRAYPSLLLAGGGVVRRSGTAPSEVLRDGR